MSVRAKFKVDAIERTKSGNDEIGTVKLSPVYDSNPSSENGQFWKWTPSGKIELGTVKPEIVAQFELGQEFYIDFTPAAKK